MSRMSSIFWRRFCHALKYRPSNIKPDPTILFSLPNNGLSRVQGGPVILGGEGRGNNSFQTILVCKIQSTAIVGNSLHPLAIILLPNSTPPPNCHGRPEIHIRLTLDIGQGGPVILRGKGCGNNNFQTILVCKKINGNCGKFSPSTGHHIAA